MKHFARLVPALLGLFVSAAPALAQDAEAGKVVFKKCVACHQVGPDAENKTGPVLNDVIGRKAGSFEGFKYGEDLTKAGEKGLVWTEELLAEYIADPVAFLRAYLDDSGARAKMSFKLKDETQRKDVAAYLATASAANAAEAEPAAPAETRSDDEVIAAQTFPDAFMADEANIDAGKEIWFAQCTHCHGSKAYPGKAPKLKPAKYTPEFVFKRAYKGFKKMPAWKDTYSVDELRQVVSYVKSKQFAP